MEQRRLRLGDILDDYCPRERRVTNHAVVAMVDDDVKQTRCTTCDSEHAYKGGREPRRRKTATAALYREVLADMPESVPPPVQRAAAAEELPVEASSDLEPVHESHEAEPGQEHVEIPQVTANASEEGPINRPLIRATLPRPDGQKDTRPVPEFTMRHNGGRGGQFRDRMNRHGSSNGNGNRAHGRRFSGGHQSSAPGRGSSGRGGGGGFRGGQHPGQQRHGGGKKRSR